MGSRKAVSATLGAEDTYTDPMQLDASERYSVSISGIFDATLTMQRNLIGGAGNWRNVEDYTGPIEKDGITVEGQEMRIGIQPGNYTSGSAVARIGKG